MEKPIKVLVVVCQLNKGGLECRLMDILRFIDTSKIQIDIFTYRLEKGYFDEEVEKLGCKIYYNKPLTIKNMLQYVEYFKEFLLKHPEYRIVHAHQDAWCSVFCKGASLAKVPVRIAHSRTAIQSITIPNLIKNIIKLPAKKYATHYFAVSDKAGEWLFGKKRMKMNQVHIWENAIDLYHFQFNSEVRKMMQKELNITEKTILIHVGNFTPPKNHEYLLDIFSCFHKKNKNSVLLLVGSGNSERKEALEIQAKKLNISDNIRFLGSRNDVDSLLQAADVFVFPSLFEGFPGAVLEAQASGLPCIISANITKDVCLLPIVKQITLKANPNVWCKEIEQALQKPRIDYTRELEEKGFDIRKLVQKLETFYIEAD